MRMPVGVLTILIALSLLWPATGFPAPTFAMVPIWKHEWTKTDFTKFSIDLAEIVSGGPPRDGIPPIDNPRFVSNADAKKWLSAQEPVLVFGHNGDVRAYPLQILIWHEIANDTVGGKPVVITFCPLCNSALVFDRTIDGRVLDFGTTGKLRRSDLVMWDRQTESWWQQLTGIGIVGKHTGTKLTFLPAPLVSYETFRAAHPGGKVLSRQTGYFRNYGGNPYVGYDSPNNSPFLLQKPVSKRLAPMERVVAVELDGRNKAYPYSELTKAGGVVNDKVGGTDLVVIHKMGTRSALDGFQIGESRDVGAAVVYSRHLDGRRLTFSIEGGTVSDRETGSTWSFLGRAEKGPLRGKKLTPINHANHFAFAWLAFRPQTQIWQAP